jgi:hypothetical protein
MISYDTRNSIIESLVNQYQKITPNNDDITRYNILYNFHMILTALIIILFFFINNKNLRLGIIILVVLIFVSQYIFRGCILSCIELRLNKGGQCFIDFGLSLMNIEITNRNRKIFTKLGWLLVIIVMIGFYYMKYYKN